MFGFGIMMFLGPLLFTIAVVVLIRAFTGETSGDRETPAQIEQMKPVKILKERFARGDIDGREYDEKRRVLEHS